MHLQQVCLTAMSFSAARGGILETTETPGFMPVVIRPLTYDTANQSSEIYVEQDNQVPGSWYVGVRNTKPLALRPRVYYPPVNTQEALLDALTKAWDFHRISAPPAPFISRVVESFI